MMTELTTDSKEQPELYTTTDVARIFAVSPKTVVRWVKKDNFKLHGVEVILTQGGHARFKKEEINDLYWKMVRDGKLAENL